MRAFQPRRGVLSTLQQRGPYFAPLPSGHGHHDHVNGPNGFVEPVDFCLIRISQSLRPRRVIAAVIDSRAGDVDGDADPSVGVD